MTAFFILIGVLLIFAVFLLSSVSLTVRYEEQLKLSVGFWGVKINVLPKKSKDSEKPREKKKKQQTDEKKSFFPLERFRHNTLSANVREVVALLRLILPEIKHLLSKTRVRSFNLDIRVANFDAARTAVEYGAVCAAVSNLLVLLGQFIDISVKKVDITAVFGEERSSVRLFFKLRLRVCMMLGLAFRLFVIYKKFTEGSINERQEHSVDN